METPIVDFVRRYSEKNTLRLHMPGHKGYGELGFEKLDITEIKGADSLYEADGIIADSERNASELFGCDTYYSTEGSSQCIRAMVWLTVLHSKAQGKRPLILAGRNAHRTFHSACALLDCDVEWLYGEDDSYLSCLISPLTLKKAISGMSEKPTAVYLTSPDYLGNMLDIRGISKVCHSYGIPLMVDNAHGAYLKFLPESLHPADLGADICCDSAHKTLPCITGGAYLHVTRSAPKLFSEQARAALSLFGSTSPSYLILQSLDLVNKYIEDGYRERLADTVAKVDDIKEALSAIGYAGIGNEPLKLSLQTSAYGYDGSKFAELLRQKNIEPEFADPDVCVLMIAPENGEYGLISLFEALISIPKRSVSSRTFPKPVRAERVISMREASLSLCENVDVKHSLGRILALSTVACPPAVPIVASGERINIEAESAFEYYGIETVNVIKE